MQRAYTEFQDQLVRGLVHRMNNILSLFHGYVGLLMDEKKLNPVVREGLVCVRDGANAASELIDRIQAISGLPAPRRDIRLPDFFRQLAPTLEGLQRPGIAISVECPEDVPVLHVDPARLRLAILELASNATEAARHNARISVTTDAGKIRIAISDDGDGVPATDASRIFEPFFSTKQSQQTAGLGLPVALGCVQQSGGTLDHRREGGETIFEIVLPAGLPVNLEAAA